VMLGVCNDDTVSVGGVLGVCNDDTVSVGVCWVCVMMILYLLVCVYAAFHIVVCGLDSILARRWINGMLVITSQESSWLSLCVLVFMCTQ